MSSEVLKMRQDKVAVVAGSATSWTVPQNCYAFACQVRDAGIDARVSRTSGVVDTPTETTAPNIYTTVKSGASIGFPDKACIDPGDTPTLYFGGASNCTVEIMYWIKQQ